MASFKTHLSVGLASSGLLATTAMVVGLANHQDMILYFMLGALGSLLPDIDSDNSIPLQVAFTLSSMFSAFSVMFCLVRWFSSVVELVLIWFAVFMFFRSVVFYLFTRLTTHRGIFHSVPAAIFFCFITSILSHVIWQFDPMKAWLSGIFVAFGFLVHLLLDEFYSVNLFGARSKKSLGTAFKFVYKQSWTASMAMYLVTLSLFFFTPDLQEIGHIIANKSFFEQFYQSFLPKDGWFNLS